MLKRKTKYNLARTVVLYLNIFFALALAGSILAGYIPPSKTPIFSVLALVYPVLILINLAFVFFWLIFKSRWFIISLLILLLGFSNLVNNFQFHFHQVAKTDSASVKLLTYNVRAFELAEIVRSLRGHKNFKQVKDSAITRRMDDFKQFIMGQDADVVCLQEFFTAGNTQYGPVEALKNEMNFNSYYYESYFGPGPRNQLAGIVIFSKYPAINKGKLKFDGSRTFGIYTDFLIHSDTVRVFNIHLASIRLLPEDIDFVVNAGQEDEKNLKGHASKIYAKLREAFLLREKQIQRIKKQIAESPYPVMLAGDFNDTPSSYVYRQITQLLQDTFREKGNGLSVTFAGRIPFLRIDYIMKSSYFKTLQYQKYPIVYSDHYPVSAVLTAK